MLLRKASECSDGPGPSGRGVSDCSIAAAYFGGDIDTVMSQKCRNNGWRRGERWNDNEVREKE